MSQPRVSDERLAWNIKNVAWAYPDSSRTQAWLDLRDARARIRELEALSASQAEALDASRESK